MKYALVVSLSIWALIVSLFTYIDWLIALTILIGISVTIGLALLDESTGEATCITCGNVMKSGEQHGPWLCVDKIGETE